MLSVGEEVYSPDLERFYWLRLFKASKASSSALGKRAESSLLHFNCILAELLRHLFMPVNFVIIVANIE